MNWNIVNLFLVGFVLISIAWGARSRRAHRRLIERRGRVTLTALLTWIEAADAGADYFARYSLVIQAVGEALKCGMLAGFAYAPEVDPLYPIVAYIELPTGQVSWHMPMHAIPWDQHTTETKYQRCRDYRREVANALA